MQRTLRWFILGLGVWILISPWILGFYAVNIALISNIIAGVIIITLSLWQLFGE
jgi:hypothetical protein